MADKIFTLTFWYTSRFDNTTFWTQGVRVNVPAESLEQAKEKATKFAMSKIKVVFEAGEREKAEKEITRVQKIMNKISSLMDDIFPHKKSHL